MKWFYDETIFIGLTYFHLVFLSDQLQLKSDQLEKYTNYTSPSYKKTCSQKTS